MNHVKFLAGLYPIKHNGEVVGEAEIDQDGRIVSGALSAKGLKMIAPDYDPTEGLSIAQPATTPWDPEWENSLEPKTLGPYIDHDVRLMEAYHAAKEKGTFDA